MANSKLANPILIRVILFLQLIPLVLFPRSIFALKSQTWWLPMILVILALVGIVQVLRKSNAAWPLYLIGFSQGFNIISRLLMLMPQSVLGQEPGKMNMEYFVLSIVAMLASAFVLWYIEQPTVKQVLVR